MRSWTLNAIVGVLVALVVALAAAAYFAAPSLIVDDEIFRTGTPEQVEREQQRLRARNDVRTSGLALVTLLGVVAGAVLTWRTVRLTREGQLADRYARAVEANRAQRFWQPGRCGAQP